VLRRRGKKLLEQKGVEVAAGLPSRLVVVPAVELVHLPSLAVGPAEQRVPQGNLEDMREVHFPALAEWVELPFSCVLQGRSRR